MVFRHQEMEKNHGAWRNRQTVWIPEKESYTNLRI